MAVDSTGNLARNEVRETAHRDREELPNRVAASDEGAARIFNATVATFAISAAWELGALDELHGTGRLDAADFAGRHGLDLTATIGMFRAMASVGVVERRHTDITVGELFDEVYRNKGFFHWLGRGSAELYQQMPWVMRHANRVGKYYRRDAAAIAFACRDINELCYEPSFQAALDRLEFPVGKVVDLGCGSGARLLNMLYRYPTARGIGIDIAPASLEVARKDMAEAGLGDRAAFVEADVLHLDPRPEFADVDLVTCYMMGHDFWPRENCVATLRRLRTAFPAARRLLIGDATRTQGVPDRELPVFTVGFELGHDLMGTFIPSLADWHGVFAEGGWDLVHTNHIDMTVGEVLFELR